MRYQVMVFVSKEILCAIDVDENGDTEVISIDGNKGMEYGREEDAEVFCGYLKGFYNIDDFSDLDISLTIVNLGADKTMSTLLFRLMNGAKDLNCINADKLLPFVALSKWNLKKNTAKNFNILDTCYRVSADENFVLTSELIKRDAESIDVRVNDLAFLYHLCGNNFKNDEELIKKQIEKQRKELEQVKREYREKLKVVQEELKAAVDRAASLEREKVKLANELDKRQKNAKRAFCVFSTESDRTQTSWNSILHIGGIWSGVYSYKLRYMVSDASNVKLDEKIARVEVFCGDGSRSSQEDYYVNATNSGRVYFIKTDKSMIQDKDIVAIIGSEEDTRRDVLNWYEQVKEK